MAREAYPTDLKDREWHEIKEVLSSSTTRGRRRTVDEREIFNAILYKLQTKCAWRMLPHDLPAWSNVYRYYRIWDADGTLSLARFLIRR